MNQDKTPHPRERRAENSRHPINNALRVRTLLLVAVFILFGMGLLIYQLYALQLRDPERYRVGAAEQQLSDEVLPATRGSIYTSTGKVLARSTTVWNIIADPSRCNEAFIAEAADKISELLDGTVTSESILEKLSDRDSQYKVLARGVDLPTKDAILEYADTERALTPGAPEEEWDTVLNIYTEQSSTRSYPYNTFLSSVLGFTDADGNGMYGLERSYNDVLAGTPGRSISMQNALGYEVDAADAEVHEPVNGYDLHLTIDENVQAIVEKYLAQAMDEYSVMNRGTVIVMDVNTGAILSMATVDQFDPNDPYTIQNEELASILDDEQLTAEEIDLLISRLGEDAALPITEDGILSEDEYTTLQGYLREAQWKNKSVTELYYPGSVFKLITAAAALDSGLVDASQEYYCGGTLTVNPDTEWEIPTTAPRAPSTTGWIWRARWKKAATSISSSWPRRCPPSSLPIITALSASTSAPASTCRMNRPVSPSPKPTWTTSSPTFTRPRSARPRNSPRSRWRQPWRRSSTAATCSRPMWWTASPTRAATLLSRRRPTSAARLFRRRSAARSAP